MDNRSNAVGSADKATMSGNIDRVAYRQDGSYQSLTNLRDSPPHDVINLRAGSSNSISRSCGETPEHFWSFKALEEREAKEDKRSVVPVMARMGNIASGQSRRVSRNTHPYNYLNRASSTEHLGGSYDSGLVGDLRGTDERTPLLRPRSSSDDSVSRSRTSDYPLDVNSPEDLRRSSKIKETMKTLNLWPLEKKRAFSLLKICLLFGVTIMACIMMLIAEEHENVLHFTILNSYSSELLLEAHCIKSESLLRSTFRGSFFPETKRGENFTQTLIFLNDENVMNLTIDPDAIETRDIVTLHADFTCHHGKDYNITATSEAKIPFEWSISALPPEVKQEVVFAFLILAFVYVLIIFEFVHRALAAMLGALTALAVLSFLHQRPSMDVIISWIDMETLTLLFGMMIIVSIFAETGFFDYSALQAYKLAKGQVWPLITLLCVFSAIVSAFLDNVTTILLMTPVTIRLCEVLNLDPKRILIAEVLFSNIGGTATAIGDPPNVIIVGALSSKGIGFSTFTMHMFPGIVIVCFIGYGVLRLYYRDMNNLQNKDPPEIAEIKHEVVMWRRAAGRMNVITREETIMKALFLQKSVEMEHNLNKIIHKQRKNERRSFYSTIKKLEHEYRIKDIPLLVKCGAVLFVVIVLLFTYSFVDSIHADIGWIAVLGAIWLLVLADIHDFEGILHKVEWATLLFFAGLFILMEALAELGLMQTIGDAIADVISQADEDNRLLVALLLILWVSALASSFIDNIPYTTAMVPILEQLADKPELKLDLLPMVVALAMGACLGGNGTLIGASCNVVCAGIADQHGYGFSFKEFFKIGFPMMLVTTVGATAYVLICHCAFHWNSI
ncbi:hypothetical protein RRG08_048618 [Elysia crispata]|uniref:Citrate transporter-like domain-containing protein n=1 Tax=Elysia crispata TaxID=231223 RepID=A0AAE1ACU1_9GAST|nr:hypothetical protein RRG08_048618 [Elysia crispata]